MEYILNQITQFFESFAPNPCKDLLWIHSEIII